jgi:2'-5' RNA ligase
MRSRIGAWATEKVRAFFAIALSPELAGQLKSVQSELRSKLPDNAVRWVKPEQLHLTLKFLGNISRRNLDDLVAAANCACDGMKPFRLSLEMVGCFPNTKVPRVIWIGIGGELESLKTLQNRIETETGRFGECDERRGFQPHLTIGRVKMLGRAAREVGESVECATVPALGEWMVRQVELMQSELSPKGARYRTLTSITLVDE